MKHPSKPRDKAASTAPTRAKPSRGTLHSQNDGGQNFPIVGIGASAGGLEALELFFKNMPEGTGMAFVVVQHLDPTQKGLLVELIQRATTMPVVQARDHLQVQPDHVYVIPPNTDISLLNGALYLFAPTAARGLRLPIDFFFRSLADDQQERSIGVVLSGMGSDGMLGLRAIKEKAGLGLAQDPASAKFDSMPRSAIGAGLADIVAPAEALPVRIIEYLHRPPVLATESLPLEPTARGALEKALILLRSKTGHDFSQYKRNTIHRRIERRMGLHKIDKITNYVRMLQDNPQEIELLFKELLIGVTNFFRDPAAWEQLRDEAFPPLLAEHPEGGTLRAWTPGCSTGEEAYSLAILFSEILEKLHPTRNYSLQIFATDLDKDAIDKARAGSYPANIASDVSTQRLNRFFIQEENGYRVCKEIRETVVFAPHDVTRDPPFTKLDVLICRNLLIYFDQELQKKLLPLFHYSLNPGGILFLGSSETVGGFSDLFSQLDGKGRLYRSRSTPQRADRVAFPAAFPTPATGITPLEAPAISMPNILTLADQLVLQRFAPATVLTTAEGDIVYISGHTGKYLEPAAGKANWNIFAMAREALRFDLTNAFHNALRQKTAITLKGMQIETNDGMQIVDIIVQALAAPQALQGMVMTVFTDVPTLPRRKASKKVPLSSDGIEQLEDLKRRVHIAGEKLRSTREVMQASQEELRSTNEELQSTNEELQSTNEELTTSKEEMQSMNEELQTVNAELQAKNDALSRSNNDMKNLLNSTDIATLFLDESLNVRRFTTRITSIINLIPSDVGRPITNITTSLDYPGMTEDALEVLRTLAFCEKAVSTHDGRLFLVRIMPYRTLDNRIDGVVITFTDISAAKRLEEILREKGREMQVLIEKMPHAFVLFTSVFDTEGKFVDCRFKFVNEAYTHLTGMGNESLDGKTAHDGWPGFKAGWIKIFEQTVETGDRSSFDMDYAPTGKRYTCNVYRPSENKDHFCIIFENCIDDNPALGAKRY